MLIDTTLREGAQMFGVRISDGDRKELALGLSAMGVEEIEAGWVGQQGLKDFLEWAGPYLGDSAISVWSRCREEDILLAAQSGVRRISLGVPASDEHRRARLNISRSGLVKRLRRMVQLARSHDMMVSVGLEDASRTDVKWLQKLAVAAEDAGAFRVRLADTIGVWNPLGVAELVNRLRPHLVIDMAVHCHNDFGMGTANAVAAMGAGAEWADVSLMGLGERSGLAATEEVAAYMTLRVESARYILENVGSLCGMAARLAGVEVPRNKPVAGRDIFACETGLHLHGMARDPGLFEPYSPDCVSGTRRFGFSEKSGSSALPGMLVRKGILPKDGLAERVRRTSLQTGRPLTLQECMRLAKKEEGGLPC